MAYLLKRTKIMTPDEITMVWQSNSERSGSTPLCISPETENHTDDAYVTHSIYVSGFDHIASGTTVN